MRVLVHSCCGPCSVYPVETLQGEGHELRLYFFNPNIQPYQEFERRLAAMRSFALKKQVGLIVDDGYDLEGWLRMVSFRESERCRLCYSLRLEAAARTAKKGGYDAFTTTLLYSKQQKHELVRELAKAAGAARGVPFLYRDFRAGWKQGIQGSIELGLYRQQYCGCVFSERERFMRRASGRGSGKAAS